MHYDWAGDQTRRRRLLRNMLMLIGIFLGLTLPVFFIPGSDLSALEQFARNLMLEPSETSSLLSTR